VFKEVVVEKKRQTEAERTNVLVSASAAE